MTCSAARQLRAEPLNDRAVSVECTTIVREVRVPFDRTQFRPLPPAAERRPLLEACDERGCLFIFNPVDGLVVTRAAGHMSTVMAEQWIASTEPVWKQAARLVVFNDWERMESYDSAARKKLTDWVIAHRTQMEGAWFLTGSRIVAMGVAAAGAATALVGVSMHASLERRAWEQTLRERMASR